MIYLLVMSLSGSIMTGVCMLLRYPARNRVSARVQYLVARIAVLYYLVPLPFLKTRYEKIVSSLIGSKYERNEIGKLSSDWVGNIINVNERKYVNAYLKMQIIVLVVWVTVFLFLFLIEIADYVRTKRTLFDHMNRNTDDLGIISVERKWLFCRLQQKIAVYQTGAEGKTMTFGLLRPVILCGIRAGERERDVVLQHEITHVRRLDILWKTFMRLVFLLHWWNPVVWFLNHDFEQICECSCDEMVLQGRSKEEIKGYLCLLVNEALMDGEKPWIRQRFGIGFEREAKKLEERIRGAMKIRKWNKTLAGILAVLLASVNSLTVFAYPEVNHTTVKGEMSGVELERGLGFDELFFAPADISKEEMGDYVSYFMQDIEIRFDEQFIDENGNIYPLQEPASDVYKSCSHEYRSGTVSSHTRNPDGSCLTIVYSAKRCIKCGEVETLKDNIISEFKHTVCPH
ncbi:MAG: M56 family metallopeptidase [Lachnospiraceae bacterium]|nr:M56 family metallopeptidase [Lachnospiraceae bacterium]